MRLFFACLLFFLGTVSSAAAGHFALAVTPAPVLNRPDFAVVFGGDDGKTLLQDDCGQLRAVEFVALPGTVFTVLEKLKLPAGTVYRVTSDDYPYPAASGYFVDARSVQLLEQRPPERQRTLPSREAILAALEKRVGVRYVWGGNLAAGTTALSEWYPPKGAVDEGLWQLAGLDCSGLLYEATGGYTPRNTSALVSLGRPVAIAGKKVAAIAKLLQPLDLIVWPGHVLVVLGGERIIESRLDCRQPKEGVRIHTLATALKEIMTRRRPADRIVRPAEEFVVRRWYGVH